MSDYEYFTEVLNYYKTHSSYADAMVNFEKAYVVLLRRCEYLEWYVEKLEGKKHG